LGPGGQERGDTAVVVASAAGGGRGGVTTPATVAVTDAHICPEIYYYSQ
jgi:hypothetical protein